MQVNKIITGNAFKQCCDDFLDDEKPYIDLSKKPKSIFIRTDWIELFKQKVLPQINYNFKLITHNGDRPCPSGNIDLLEDTRLIKWYGMNCEIQHPKIQPIPIGIANEMWPHGNKEILLEISNSDITQTKLCYSNFEINTNYHERLNIFNIVKTKNFVSVETQKLNFKDYLLTLKTYKYIISPPGNSIDCHRIWEAIYLGVIPIIKKHLAMEYFYDLPILIVNNFDEITTDLLVNNYSTIKQKSHEKAYLQYYTEKIKQ